jgi:hypothetical protein
MFSVAVVGTHAPGATCWHAVFASVAFATPQQIQPGPVQSIAPRQLKPAYKLGHAVPWGTHWPWAKLFTQHVLVLRLQSCAFDWTPHI